MRRPISRQFDVSLSTSTVTFPINLRRYTCVHPREVDPWVSVTFILSPFAQFPFHLAAFLAREMAALSSR